MNDHINTWLHMLAGSDHNHNKLLDWMACAPNLDKSLCGLIFAGPPQTGKDLFATGLRVVWDHLPESVRVPFLVYKDSPSALRRLDRWTLDHYPQTRFIVATNHPTTIMQHVETVVDLQEIEHRYLYLEHTEEAAEYLAIHKSRLKTWAEQEIAATVEGLNRYRKVERAGPLWVQGDIGAMRHLVNTPTDKGQNMAEKIEKTTDEDDSKTKQKQTEDDKDEEIIMGESYSGCK